VELFVFDVVVLLLIEVGGLLFCIRRARQLHEVEVAAANHAGCHASNGIEVHAVDPSTNYTVYPSA
jgi:phage gp46-like protein